MPIHKMPFTRIEICLLSIVENRLCVLLGLRERSPDENLWALPGGVVRTDLDKDLDASVQRVSMERLNSVLVKPKQQITVGGANKDPRDPWALSIVYRALIRADHFESKAGKRLKDLRWNPVNELPKLALGHNDLVSQSVESLRTEVNRMEVPFDLLPPHFFLTEAKLLCDTIRGFPKDASRFRKNIEASGQVEPIGPLVALKKGRPAQMYKKSSLLDC